MQHMSDKLADQIDEALGEAIRTVEDEEAQKTGVSVAFVVARDEDGEVSVDCTVKAQRATKQSWRPSSQPRLAFDRAAGD